MPVTLTNCKLPIVKWLYLLTKKMILKKIPAIILLQLSMLAAWAQTASKAVPDSVMQRVYEQVKTPYKYGLVDSAGR